MGWFFENSVPEAQAPPVTGGAAARRRAALGYFSAVCKSSAAFKTRLSPESLPVNHWPRAGSGPLAWQPAERGAQPK